MQKRSNFATKLIVRNWNAGDNSYEDKEIVIYSSKQFEKLLRKLSQHQIIYGVGYENNCIVVNIFWGKTIRLAFG